MKMNGNSGGHRPRPALLGLLGALLAMLGIAALAACGGSSTSTTASGNSSTSSAYQKALAYAQCVRAHGVPDYPDPNSRGQFIVPNGSGNTLPSVSPASLDAANKACHSLLPPSMAMPPKGRAPSSDQLKFSQCMRRHGEPSFPDPAAIGSLTLPPGMDAQSPQFQNAEKACQSLMPQNPGGQDPAGQNPGGSAP
jgi:hypothetical protein